jgi:hypothetical protein
MESVGADAGGVAVASCAMTGDGVAVAGRGVGLIELSLNRPGDGGVLMIIVLPSGMRDTLSVLFMAPKSMQSTRLSSAS